jgi:hypothetical protein
MGVDNSGTLHLQEEAILEVDKIVATIGPVS